MTATVDGSSCASVFDAGLPTINYEHAQHPDEAHAIISQARKKARRQGYKLIDPAQARSRKVNAANWSPWSRAGAVFHEGKLLERPSISHPTGTDRINRNGGRLKHPNS